MNNTSVTITYDEKAKTFTATGLKTNGLPVVGVGPTRIQALFNLELALVEPQVQYVPVTVTPPSYPSYPGYPVPGDYPYYPFWCGVTCGTGGTTGVTWISDNTGESPKKG